MESDLILQQILILWFMADKLLIDSCLLVALYLSNDSQHEKSVDFFRLHEEGYGFVMLESILRETITVIQRKGGLQLVQVFLDDLQELLDVQIISEDFSSELSFFQRLQEPISFFDASLLYYADLMELPLITFDTQLKNIYIKKRYSIS